MLTTDQGMTRRNVQLILAVASRPLSAWAGNPAAR